MHKFTVWILFILLVVILGSINQSSGEVFLSGPLAPSVIGPISVCNENIEVQGQLTGSIVRVYANGRLVAEGTASWSKQVFPLLPGEVLNPGEEVVAEQEDKTGTISDRSPTLVYVQSAPAQVGPVSFTTEVFACGECIRLTGAVPGANVEVGLYNGVIFDVRGHANATHGDARIGLNPPTGMNEKLAARQTACGIPGPFIEASPATILEEFTAELEPPNIEEPLLECQDRVTITDVLPGAIVTVERSNGQTHSACFDAPHLYFPVEPPLELDEELVATAEFPRCGLSSKSLPVLVDCADPVPEPFILSPICAGSTEVWIANLEPGSKVNIFIDGIDLGIGEASDYINKFNVPPLSSGTVSATQELCGNWSLISNEVLVDTQPPTTQTPEIVVPIYSCGGAVHVKNVTPGAQIIIWSEQLGAPIGQAFAFTNEALVKVSPHLMSEDRIYAEMTGCEGLNIRSDLVPVDNFEGIKAPSVTTPIFVKANSVLVSDVVPGSTVDIYINGLWQGANVIAGNEGVITLLSSVEVGDSVHARQRLCSEISEVSSEVIVVPPPPQAVFDAFPQEGLAPLITNFTNQTSGVFTDLEWDFDGNGTTDNTSENPSYTYTQPGEYDVRLTAIGPGGNTHTILTVTVLEPPSALFSALPLNGTAPLLVSFNNNSAGSINNYTWDFDGNGITNSTLENPSYTYQTPGSYTVTLTAFGPENSSDTISHTITVTQPVEQSTTLILAAKHPFGDCGVFHQDHEPEISGTVVKIKNESGYLLVIRNSQLDKYPSLLSIPANDELTVSYQGDDILNNWIITVPEAECPQSVSIPQIVNITITYK